MKKLILSTFILSAFFVMSVSAQDVNMKSKRGENILPEKGDWAISIDAHPFLDYIGAFLSQDGADGPDFQFLTNDNYIAGKYFVEANKAYRAKVRIGFGSASTTDANKNKIAVSHTDVTLGAGMEMRKGKGRLQGVYGAEALINLTGGKTKYTYDQTPGTGTILEDKVGGGFGIGVRGFIGAEYFVLPKLSIGAEYGWGLMFSSVGEGTRKFQGIDDVKTGKSSSFGLDTDVSPTIVLTLHF